MRKHKKSSPSPKTKNKFLLYLCDHWKKILLIVATFFACALLFTYLIFFFLLNGPSDSLRNSLVLSARQHKEVRWIPSLFLSDGKLGEIDKAGRKIVTDTLDPQDITVPQAEVFTDGLSLVEFETENWSGKMLIIQDPSRLFVGCASDFQGSEKGKTIFEIGEDYPSVAGVAAGEYPDRYGFSDGSRPSGITYSEGSLVYSGATKSPFIGFTYNNTLVVTEGMNGEKAKEMNIRDGVCTATSSILLSMENGEVTAHYTAGNEGRAQRTVVGQRADGTVLLLVTDKTLPNHKGATHNEVLEIMLSFGAVNAGILESGFAADLYCENWHETYGVTDLTRHREMGVVNENSPLAESKKRPTYFLVKEVAQ